MPNKFGLLTDEDRAAVTRWWDAKWKGPVVCPVCQTTEWGLAPHVVSLLPAGVSPAMAGAPAYHMIMVGCKNCSHGMFFSAVTIGVMAAYDPVLDQQLALTKQE